MPRAAGCVTEKVESDEYPVGFYPCSFAYSCYSYSMPIAVLEAFHVYHRHHRLLGHAGASLDLLPVLGGKSIGSFLFCQHTTAPDKMACEEAPPNTPFGDARKATS